MPRQNNKLPYNGFLGLAIGKGISSLGNEN